MKHYTLNISKGTWVVGEEDEGPSGDWPFLSIDFIPSGDASPKHYGMIYVNTEDPEERLANAKAIAALPDILKYLQSRRASDPQAAELLKQAGAEPIKRPFNQVIAHDQDDEIYNLEEIRWDKNDKITAVIKDKNGDKALLSGNFTLI